MKGLSRLGLKRLGRNKRAFTLIELLIVLLIIATLAGVVAYSATRFIGTGEEQACELERGSVQIAVTAYYVENGAWPTDSGGAGDIDWDKISDWFTAELPYFTACDWEVNSAGLVSVGDSPSDCPCVVPTPTPE